MMKINLDPMPQLRADAEARVNLHFTMMAGQSVQQDQEHKIKREIAASVLNEGASAPFAFQEEAKLMGLTTEALAEIISDKPDTVLDRGLQRRAVILQVRSAQSPAHLDSILEKAGISKMPGY